MVRLLFLCCVLLVACGIGIAQEYYYEADVADYGEPATADYNYESGGYHSESYSDGSSSKEMGEEYLLKPGVFSPDNRQEKELKEKVTNVTSGTMKTLLVIGLLGIGIMALVLNNMR